MEDVQYWVIGGVLSLCAVAFFMVMVPLFAWRNGGLGGDQFGGVKPPPPLPRGRVSVGPIRLYDALGVGLFFGLYAMMWLALALSDPEKMDDMEISPLLMSTELLVQGFMIVVVCLFLFWRVGLVKFFGLKWKYWWLAPLLAVPVVFLMMVLNAVLMMSGYESWILEIQGYETAEEAQQEVVTMIKESEDPWMFVVLAVLAIVGAPLSEEVVFRGYIYPVVKRFSNIPISVVFTGLLFSAVHGNLAALLPLFILGMLLAVLYEVTGSLWVPIAVHALFNAVSVLVMKLMMEYPEWFEELEEKTAWLMLGT